MIYLNAFYELKKRFKKWSEMRKNGEKWGKWGGEFLARTPIILLLPFQQLCEKGSKFKGILQTVAYTWYKYYTF